MKKKIYYICIILFILSIFYLTDNDVKYEVKQKGSLYGVVDKNEKVILPFEYKKIFKQDKEYILLKNSKIEVREKNLKLKQILEGNDVYPLNKYNFLIKKGEKYYIYSRGKEFEVNHSVEQVFDKYIVKRVKEKIIVEDLFSKKVILNEYDGVYFENLNTIIVEKNGKYGVINKDNKIEIPLKYDEISPLINGKYYIVENNYKSGVINKKGEEIIPTIYEMIDQIIGNYVIISTLEGVGVINLNNQIVIEPIYDYILQENNEFKCYLKKKLVKKIKK